VECEVLVWLPWPGSGLKRKTMSTLKFGKRGVSTVLTSKCDSRSSEVNNLAQ